MGRKQRSPSMILIENQKKEAQLWFEEANCHFKAGNPQKALAAYNKVIGWITSFAALKNLGIAHSWKGNFSVFTLFLNTI